MDGAFDLPDSTDWLNTPLKDFATLESSLHCQICREFYDTPMITSCSHTFCSKCIRTSLSSDGKCPACRTADQASKLRNNWALQEVVATFQAARPAALDVARRDGEQEAAEASRRPGKRKRTVLDSDDIAQAEQDIRTTRSKSRRLAASQTSHPESIEIFDSDGDGEFEPEQEHDDGLVECPLGCGRRMKVEAVEPHLDKCEDEKKQSNRPKSQTPVNALRPLRPTSAQGSKPQDRLSELNYSLLTDTKLTKKLKELGIPDWGSKQLMVKRHTAWVNLWNANCDSSHPRSKRDLLKDLDAWERTQGGKASTTNGTASSVMRKDFDGASWANKNKDDFSRLIAEAQRRKHNPATEQDRPKDMAMVGERVTSTAVGSEPPSTDILDPPTPPLDPSLDLRPYDGNAEAIGALRGQSEKAGVDPTLLDGLIAPEDSVRTPVKLPKPLLEHDDRTALAQNHERTCRTLWE